MTVVLSERNVPEQRRGGSPLVETPPVNGADPVIQAPAIQMSSTETSAVQVQAIEALAAEVGLRVRAVGVWPGDDDDLPGVAGFIESSFNPLVVEATRRALTVPEGSAPVVPPEQARTTAVILVSGYGDVASARAVAQAVDDGTRVGPLLFFQSVPNAVAGYLAMQWGFAGPVLAISPAGEAYPQGLAVADLLIADGDADAALLVFVEAPVTRQSADRALTVPQGKSADRALAVLVERKEGGA